MTLEEITSQKLEKKFCDAYALRSLLMGGVFTDEVVPPNLGIKLSKSGRTILNKVKRKKEFQNIEENVMKLAIFMSFNDSQLFIDLTALDTEQLEKFISEQII